MLPAEYSLLARHIEQRRDGRSLGATSAVIIKRFADCDTQANIGDVSAKRWHRGHSPLVLARAARLMGPDYQKI